MAGLIPAIHVDPRDKPGDDGLKWPQLPAFRRPASALTTTIFG